jgi:hypothetical protein
MNHKLSSQKIPQSMPSSHCDVTHHNINQLSYGLNEGPYPFAVGLRVNGTGRCANDQATQALLGVYLHKV